jgi:RNA-directed DNA polymerase
VAGRLSGKPEAEADDECEGEVGPVRSSREASEQSGLGCGGARGAKGQGQGECGNAKHGPDAEPGSRVTGAGPHTRSVIRNRRDKLTALLHHLAVDVLRASFFGLKKSAAPGVEEVTWTEYAEGLEENLTDLHSRVQTGTYRALPSRRTYIPKADGRQRPLGIAAVEDKIVQAAVMAILTPIYESEFLGFSYGFRPKRNQHQALDALAFGIGKRRINWVFDCDVQSFFDKVSREWLIRFVEHRIGDRRITRLIAKWLTAGVLEDGRVIETEEGTPQGAVISPLLANIYLFMSMINGSTSGGSDAPLAT